MAEKAKSKGRKIGRNKTKCDRYTARDAAGNTAKTRRVARALIAGLLQPGWKLNEAGTEHTDGSGLPS